MKAASTCSEVEFDAAELLGDPVAFLLGRAEGEARPGTPMNVRIFTLVALAQALEVTVAELLPPDPTVPIGGR